MQHGVRKTRTPISRSRCGNDRGLMPVLGVIPYEAGSWIMLTSCWYCNEGSGELSDPDYGWSDAVTFWYDSDERSYRASLAVNWRWPHRKAALIVPRVEERLNNLIVADENAVPRNVSAAAGQMDIEDASVPVEPPASFWDGWMTRFEPGVLSRRPSWRG